MKPCLMALCFLAAVSTAGAHSASDAYLNLSVDHESKNRVVLHGQWDIALRDLDFVLKLDDNGDGKVTWGEVKRHAESIERYAYSQLQFGGRAGNECSIKPVRLLIDRHADGAYAALMFDVVCTTQPKTMTMGYKLFFAIDPSHRGIFVLQSGENTSTALLSPQNAQIDLTF